MVSVLVYGVTGFTGALVSRELARRGIRHSVAGRRKEAVLAHAREVGAEARVFDLGDPAAVRRGLAGFGAVLNCAGPFRATAPKLSSAAIEASIAYLDLAGEVEEHEALRARDGEARASGSMLLPGVGFGVVPTDCAAALAGRARAGPPRLLEA
jgi:saccharopine dehydrogenase (NAD+, L-lysine-forming)